MIPEELLYTEEHEWILVADDLCTLGITDFAQNELGEVVYVDLPEVGQRFDAGDEIGSLESVKAVAEIYAPVSGEVVEVNTELEDAPETVNDDAHKKGWLIKLRLSSPTETERLMDAKAYRDFLKGKE